MRTAQSVCTFSLAPWKPLYADDTRLRAVFDNAVRRLYGDVEEGFGAATMPDNEAEDEL